MPTVEELQEELLNLQEQLKAKEELITALEGQNQDKDNRILSLQEHNQRLFLRLQADDLPTQEDKEEPVPTMEDIANKYKGVIN